MSAGKESTVCHHHITQKNDVRTRTTMPFKSSPPSRKLKPSPSVGSAKKPPCDVKISRFGMLIVFIATRKELLSSTNRPFFYLVFTMIIFIISF